MSLLPYHRAVKSGAPPLGRAWGLYLGLLVGLLLSLARGGGFFNTWRLRSTDFLHGDVSPGDDIVIVTIDDASLARLGPWPWPHSTHTQLLEALAEARVIGMDILFEATSPDDDLIEATAEAGNVIYPLLAVLPEHAGLGIIPARLLIEPPLALQSSAAGLGTVNVLPDGDGVVRRVPLVIQQDDRLVETFGLQVLRLYLELPPEPPGELNTGLFIAGPLTIPVDRWGRMVIRFAGEPGAFPTVSYADVLSGTVPPETFQDKIVLVGQLDVTGGGDIYIVPTSHGGREMSGVEIQANIIHTILGSLGFRMVELKSTANSANSREKNKKNQCNLCNPW